MNTQDNDVQKQKIEKFWKTFSPNCSIEDCFGSFIDRQEIADEDYEDDKKMMEYKKMQDLATKPLYDLTDEEITQLKSFLKKQDEYEKKEEQRVIQENEHYYLCKIICFISKSLHHCLSKIENDKSYHDALYNKPLIEAQIGDKKPYKMYYEKISKLLRDLEDLEKEFSVVHTNLVNLNYNITNTGKSWISKAEMDTYPLFRQNPNGGLVDDAYLDGPIDDEPSKSIEQLIAENEEVFKEASQKMQKMKDIMRRNFFKS